MNSQIISNHKHTLTRLSAVILVIMLLLPACARQPRPARVEEITFQSGEFKLVGDLRTPAGTAPFPVILFVHGDSPANRTGFGMDLPIMERMLRAGYAVFSWDNPGAGESTGATDRQQITQQQAQIVTEAIEVMKDYPGIDHWRIGLWGVSMGGYVMGRVLITSDDVAFMICQSCGSMSGNDEFVYLTVAQGFCSGGSEEDATQLDVVLAEFDEARTFDTYKGYLHYRQVLAELAALGSVTVPHPVASEATWLANDPSFEYAWSPMEVIAHANIPVLAIWGERDTKIDAIRAAHAYGEALEQAGNSNYRIEVIPGADHNLVPSETGCISEEGQILEGVLAEQGFTWETLETLDPQDPALLTIGSAFPYAPKYLDMIEEWLTGLKP